MTTGVGGGTVRLSPYRRQRTAPVQAALGDVQVPAQVHGVHGTVGVSYWRCLTRRLGLSADWEAVEWACLPAGGVSGAHLHTRTEELYFILSGTGRIAWRGGERVVRPGDLIATPVGAQHGLTNIGTEPLAWLVTEVSAPAQAAALADAQHAKSHHCHSDDGDSHRRDSHHRDVGKHNAQHEGIEDGTPYGGTENSTPYGGTENSTPYGGTENSTQQGGTENSTQQGGTENSTQQGGTQHGGVAGGIGVGTQRDDTTGVRPVSVHIVNLREAGHFSAPDVLSGPIRDVCLRRLAPGDSTELIADGVEYTAFAVAGQGVADDGGTAVELSAGAAVTLPLGGRLTVRARGDQPLELFTACLSVDGEGQR